MTKNINVVELDETLLHPKDKFHIMTYNQEDLSAHNHKFFELAYVKEGTALHTLNGVRTTLHPGDYYIVDYGSVHSYENCQNLILINCLFQPEIINETLKGCCSFESLLHVCLLRYYKLYLGNTPANRIYNDEDGRILSLLNGMLKEYEEKNVGYTEIFTSRLFEILILIMRNVIDDQVSILQNEIILEVILYIRNHFQSHNLLSNFCNEYHYSPQYISRKFKEDTGFTISEYVQKIRIEKSCKLLVGSTMTIGRIAEEVGYTDLKFFNQLFKKIIKMSPRDFRKLSLYK